MNLLSEHPLKTEIAYEGLYKDRLNPLEENLWESKDFEIRGTREKLILHKKNQEAWYLFKKPKYGKVEIDTEVFNSILANELQIKHVQYFPVRFRGQEGVLCKSFLDEHKEEPFGLTEMKALICNYSGKPDLKEKMGRDVEILKEHNIKNIFNIIKQRGYEDSILKDFFKMIGLSALIGHGDRHWCNYGFLTSKKRADNVKFSPIYDTSSGYLTEIQEESKLKEKMRELDDEEWYQAKARIKGLCKITIPEDYKATHFDLLTYILKDTDMREYREDISLAFEGYSSRLVQAILKRFFPNLTEMRKQIILKILDKRASIGIKIIRGKNA
ncbi:MAG: HipA domain-containing protein [Oligoflexia bacterium]|nr:HipA domain-containing protein [Oligoflexia bacterium]